MNVIIRSGMSESSKKRMWRWVEHITCFITAHNWIIRDESGYDSKENIKIWRPVVQCTYCNKKRLMPLKQYLNSELFWSSYIEILEYFGAETVVTEDSSLESSFTIYSTNNHSHLRVVLNRKNPKKSTWETVNDDKIWSHGLILNDAKTGVLFEKMNDFTKEV